MRSTSVLSAAALCLVSACSNEIPVEPTVAAISAFSARASVTSDEQGITVDPGIAAIALNDVARPAGDYVVATAQLLYDVNAVSNASASLILANDREKLTEAQWVPGDPRRGGLPGLRWGYVGLTAGVLKFDPAVPGFIRAALPEELEPRIVEGMGAWESRNCSTSPITRLLPTDPGVPDIFQVGWLPNAWFAMNFPPNGSSILGVTLTSIFVNNLTDRIPTDIDGNGRPDIAFQDIIYNAGHIWSDNGPFGSIDLFTVIAHESGHAFGLDHFGKVFVTKKDIIMTPQGPTVRAEDIRYAPKALMNAVYIMGRTDVTGTDNAAFCQIWSGR